MKKWIPYPRFLIRKNIIKSILKNEDLNLKKGIEIGFGGGEMLFHFIKEKIDISGFDESIIATRVASERLQQQNCKVNFYESYQDIPQNNFDYLFAFEVLEHIKDDSNALDTWLKLLTANGKIIISVPAHQKRFSTLDKSVGHYRRYDKTALINALSSKNLEIIYFWNYGFPIINLLEKIANLLLQSKKNIEFGQKELLSYKSFEANDNFLIRLISNDIILFPFYCLQHIFLKTDLGSGYVILAQKKSV